MLYWFVTLVLPCAVLLAARRHAGKCVAGMPVSVAGFVLAVLLCWLAVVLGAMFTQWQLEAQLQAFDLNGDGVFSAAEQTPAQQQAMQAVIRDTGRVLAPLTGAVGALVYVTVLAGAMRLILGRPRP